MERSERGRSGAGAGVDGPVHRSRPSAWFGGDEDLDVLHAAPILAFQPEAW